MREVDKGSKHIVLSLTIQRAIQHDVILSKVMGKSKSRHLCPCGREEHEIRDTTERRM
jgi:hypothetical protein